MMVIISDFCIFIGVVFDLFSPSDIYSDTSVK